MSYCNSQEQFDDISKHVGAPHHGTISINLLCGIPRFLLPGNSILCILCNVSTISRLHTSKPAHLASNFVSKTLTLS